MKFLMKNLYYEKLYSSCEPDDCNLSDLLIDSGAPKAGQYNTREL